MPTSYFLLSKQGRHRKPLRTPWGPTGGARAREASRRKQGCFRGLTDESGQAPEAEGEIGSKGVTMEGTMTSKRPEGKKSLGSSSCLKQSLNEGRDKLGACSRPQSCSLKAVDTRLPALSNTGCIAQFSDE